MKDRRQKSWNQGSGEIRDISAYRKNVESVLEGTLPSSLESKGGGEKKHFQILPRFCYWTLTRKVVLVSSLDYLERLTSFYFLLLNLSKYITNSSRNRLILESQPMVRFRCWGPDSGIMTYKVPRSKDTTAYLFCRYCISLLLPTVLLSLPA